MSIVKINAITVPRWSSEEDFQIWVDSPVLQYGHKAQHAHGPVSSRSEPWSFEVVQREHSPF